MKSLDVQHDPRRRDIVFPARLILAEGPVEHPERLIVSRVMQPAVNHAPGSIFGAGSSIILDFGRELSGGVRIVTGRFSEKKQGKTRRIRIRFGESVSETMSEPCYGHAITDSTELLTTLAIQEFGSTGFRFVRLDFFEETELLSVQAVFLHYTFESNYFECSDPLLNRIWQTAVDTLEMCCQDFVWDGVKRDRLLWMGDLYPELLAGQVCFGQQEIFARTMDWLRDATPLPGMMNGSVTYSIYWLLSQCAWFRFHGDMTYLSEQREYLTNLLDMLLDMVGNDGRARLSGGWELLDWTTGCDASQETINSIHAGNQALLLKAFVQCVPLLDMLGETVLARSCAETIVCMKKYLPPLTSSKSNLALQTLAGLRSPMETAPLIIGDGTGNGFSTFHGGFMLEALSIADRTVDALNIARNYWGGMLALGATSFWEHFDVRWLDNAARIDELTPQGRNNIHQNCGEGCFKGFRHSLCHGWAASVNVWISERILGIRQVSPAEIILDPQPCGLEHIAGSYRTQHGILQVEVTGGQCIYEAPKNLKITRRKS